MKNNDSACGIECEFKDVEDVWKFVQFSGIDFGTRYFSVVFASVLSEGRLIVLPDTYDSTLFQELIRHRFASGGLVVHLYPAGAPKEKIDSYDDFLRSACEMIILMCDCFYVEIYCKNAAWLQTLLRTAKEIPGTSVCEKYVDTDTRERMYV